MDSRWPLQALPRRERRGLGPQARVGSSLRARWTVYERPVVVKRDEARERARRRRKEKERVRKARKARRGRVCRWTLERDREARVERERDAEWDRQLREWERERLESEEQWRERDKRWREREAELERSQRELEIEMQKNDRILKELWKEVQRLLDLFPKVVRRPVMPGTGNLERIEDGSGVGAGDLRVQSRGLSVGIRVFCDEEVVEEEGVEEESPY